GTVSWRRGKATGFGSIAPTGAWYRRKTSGSRPSVSGPRRPTSGPRRRRPSSFVCAPSSQSGARAEPAPGRAVVLLGPRQVGKTVLLLQLADDLLEAVSAPELFRDRGAVSDRITPPRECDFALFRLHPIPSLLRRELAGSRAKPRSGRRSRDAVHAELVLDERAGPQLD